MRTFPRFYPTTALEDWVTDLYLRLKIYRPDQINEELLARQYGIHLHKKPIPASYEILGDYKGITIDNREPDQIQRETFFHELCHILRHYGIQTKMSNAFRHLQEWEAQNFVRYAAIPHHMIKFIDLDHPYAIDQMVNIFKVTPKLCKERLEQIKSRCAQSVSKR